MNDLKQEYLDAKYAEYDDESDVPYKHKRVKHHVKKSNHKHKYENVVVVDPDKKDSFNLMSRCFICGKIGDVKKDNRIDKKFPHVRYGFLCGYMAGYESEYEDFVSWCKEHYDVIETPEFDMFRTKYI